MTSKRAVLFVAAAALGAWLVGAAAGCGHSGAHSAHASASGAAGKADHSPPLAVVGDDTITVADLQSRLAEQSPYVRARYTSTVAKERFLDNMIRFEVLAQEAKKKGLDKDPDVIRTMKQVMVQKLMADVLANGIKPQDITDAEMRAFYKQHQNEFNKPEQVRVSAIIVADKHKAAAVARRAKGKQGETNAGFTALVTKYSADAVTKSRGGDLRYFARDTHAVPAPVVKAAFALQHTGDVGGPIAAGGRYYIIKRTGHRGAITRTFAEVKRQIQNRLYRQKRTEAEKQFIANLRKRANIKVYKNNLAKVHVDTGVRGAHPQAAGAGMRAAPRAPAAPPPPAGNATTHP